MHHVLSAQDEGIHPWGPEENWQESVVLGWRDEVAGVGGHQRISIQPNRGTSNLWCAVYSNRDRIYRLNLEREPFEPLAAGLHGLRCGPQRMFHDGDVLRLQLDTPECTVDLVIDDIKNSIEWVGSHNVGGLAAMVYREHFNVHCRVRGDVVLNGVRHRVENGIGWRDHSWGPRDWSQVLCHRSFHGSIGDDLTFHFLTVMNREGALMRRGHLVRNGQAKAVSDFTVRTEFLEDGITPVEARCLIMTEDEEPLLFHAILQKGVFAEVENKFAFYGTGECWHKGVKGFGDVEVTNNARAGEKPLKLTIGNVHQNGFYEIDIPEWNYLPLAEIIK